MGAREVGEKCMKEFIKQRIETQEVDFYTKISKNKLKTFDHKNKVNVVKSKNKNTVLKSDRQTFANTLYLYLLLDKFSF